MIEPGAASFNGLVDLAAAAFGGRALETNDEFFAGMDNLLLPGRGSFIPGKYTERGKWMDGWESRRKRVPGHDWCIIQLAVFGKIHGVDIDLGGSAELTPVVAAIAAIDNDHIHLR